MISFYIVIHVLYTSSLWEMFYKIPRTGRRLWWFVSLSNG